MLASNYLMKLCLAAVVCVSAMLSSGNVYADDLAPPPERPHFVMDADSGEILSMKLPFVRWAPASLTKMMTAYTVLKQLELQHISFNSPVLVSEYALSQPPSKMGMPVGTIMTVEAALSIIMVKSANDISVALAESVAGSEEQFVQLMNSHARRLGMMDTNFANPHGLHDRSQYTSARDMAVLANAITRDMKEHDRFFDIPGIRVGKRRLRNHNALVERFPGTTGMKTGYVCASGFNVVVRTEREGKTLIAVVLGGKSGRLRNIKTAKLLAEGFEGDLAGSGETLNTLVRPASASKIPRDITTRICPGKYAANAVPDKRPDDAPRSTDFDPIDTPMSAGASKAPDPETMEAASAVPQKRPAKTVSIEQPKISSAAETIKEIPATASGAEGSPENVSVEEKREPGLLELEHVYLQPRKRARDDVEITLGGALGPNPNGIRHTNGGKYVPPIPVPTKNPS